MPPVFTSCRAAQGAGIRPGTLSDGFVETFRVAIHGKSVAIGRMASVTRQGERIVVTPFDPAIVPAVVKALTEARLNAYALNPRAVAVGVPPISGEQRAEIARHVKKLGDEAKVAVRAIRLDAHKRMPAQAKALSGGCRRRRCGSQPG